MLFQEIFSQAKGNKEDLNEWFERKTAKFGGKDAIAPRNGWQTQLKLVGCVSSRLSIFSGNYSS